MKTKGPNGYLFILDQEDLSLISVAYCIPMDFELELLEIDAQIDNPPPSILGVYEEAFEVGLRFLVSPFILEFLRSYGIPLCILTPNSIRLLIGFMGICLLAKVQPSLGLFHSFYTTQKHPYAKVW